MSRASERIAYHNGRFVPEREVLVPFRDRGFKYGDAVFDTTRTFGHRVFKLREHVERLYRSLRYLRIDPGLTPAAMVEITEEVLRRNLSLLEPDDDYWVTQRVSRGLDASAREIWPQTGATVIVECVPLPLRERAPLYRDGIRVLVPSVRRTPPEALSPRVKTHNYLNIVAANLEIAARDPEAWAVLLDTHGNLAEGLGSNIFLVQQGTLYTPREQFVLAGHQPGHRDRAGARGRPHRRREGPGPVRRLQRRRGVPDVDQSVRLPGAQHQRGRHRRWAGAGPGDPAAHRGVLPVRRLRLRGAVPEASGLRT